MPTGLAHGRRPVPMFSAARREGALQRETTAQSPPIGGHVIYSGLAMALDRIYSCGGDRCTEGMQRQYSFRCAPRPAWPPDVLLCIENYVSV